MTESLRGVPGDMIQFKGLPFKMKIRGVRTCEAEHKKKSHVAYKITDPEGQTDWVCERDVILVKRSATKVDENSSEEQDESENSGSEAED